MARSENEFKWSPLPTIEAYCRYKLQSKNDSLASLANLISVKYGVVPKSVENKISNFRFLLGEGRGLSNSNSLDKIVHQKYETYSAVQFTEVLECMTLSKKNHPEYKKIEEIAYSWIEKFSPKTQIKYVNATIEHGLSLDFEDNHPGVLLTWNPTRWDWSNLLEDYEKFVEYGYIDVRWSTGATKNIELGTRCFFMKLGSTPKNGIFASGVTISKVFEGDHWESEGKKANFAKIRIDFLSDPKNLPPIPEYFLKNDEILKTNNWFPQSSGQKIQSGVVKRLEKELFTRSVNMNSGLEAQTGLVYSEGQIREVVSKRYERNKYARYECLKHHGYKCKICNFDFKESYGELGEKFIHVHHKNALSTIGRNYNVDPVNDLIPLCPNCHAMIHKRKPELTIEELIEIVRFQQNIN